MELAMPRDGDGPYFARFTKLIRDANVFPIGCSHDNPLLDTQLYEVEYADGNKESLSANAIAINMFAQVDEEGNRHVFLDEIVDHRTDGTELKQNDTFITSRNGGRRRHETTKGWEILLQWKDGSTSWETLKDIKECYPLQISEYAVRKRISDEPFFYGGFNISLRDKSGSYQRSNPNTGLGRISLESKFRKQSDRLDSLMKKMVIPYGGMPYKNK